MASNARVMCYINQFFAGMGGEDKADVPLGSLEGAQGPGKRLQELLGDRADIVVTAFCGDNYFNDHREEVVKKILGIARAFDVKIVVAGPAFGSGRYAFACVEVCHAVSTSLNLDCITGMSMDNPAVNGYKQYKDETVFVYPTRANVIGMEEALTRMAKGVFTLVAGSGMGPASEEGYIPRGIRVFDRAARTGAERAIDMLLDKVAGRFFSTEITVEVPERVTAAPPLDDLKGAHLAMVTSSGLTLVGNPYKFKIMANSQWKKYPIAHLDSMNDAKWDVVHGGINTAPLYKDANYGAPLDICRKMEKEGIFSKLAPDLYGTTGFAGAVAPMQAIAREMAHDMKAQDVNGVLLVSTWGTDTRSGAVISKELEKEGLPVAFITAMISIANQEGVNRIIEGVAIPHPCGDPTLSEEADLDVRRKIVGCSLEALQKDVEGPTVFKPDTKFAKR